MANICPTVRVEKLLLCTDGSSFSEGAVREAIKLAKHCSTNLSAMSVIETNPEFETIAPEIIEKAVKSSRENLESVQALAKREGVECDIVIRQGEDSYEYIIDEAKKRTITMIIMGRRGRTGLKRLMMGSVTARVIGLAPCNVLVVPSAAQVNFENVLLATDGSRYSEAAASEAIGIARRCGSRLTVLSVVPSESMSPMDIVHSQMHRELIQETESQDAEKNIAAVLEVARKEGVSVSGLVLGGKPAEAIVQTADKIKADVVVLGSHGATGVDRFLMGSVTERVIVLSSSAVLVVKTA